MKTSSAPKWVLVGVGAELGNDRFVKQISLSYATMILGNKNEKTNLHPTLMQLKKKV